MTFSNCCHVRASTNTNGGNRKTAATIVPAGPHDAYAIAICSLQGRRAMRLQDSIFQMQGSPVVRLGLLMKSVELAGAIA